MPNIKPISELRNYASLLEDVEVGKPLYLTKNGHGCYTIMDMQEQEQEKEKAEMYDLLKAELTLLCELNEGHKSGVEEGWVSSIDMLKHFENR